MNTLRRTVSTAKEPLPSRSAAGVEYPVGELDQFFGYRRVASVSDVFGEIDQTMRYYEWAEDDRSQALEWRDKRRHVFPVVMFFQSLARATRWLTQSCANRALGGAVASNETGPLGVPAAGGILNDLA
jgi:hypothetical protein